jgi:carbamoyl-phosphate synthase large subunit
MNVLITCAGRRVRLVELFKESTSGIVVASDADRLAPSLYAADAGEVVPLLEDPTYMDVLKQIIDRHEIGLIVPTIDTELSLIADHRDAIQEVGCLAVISDPDFVAITFDKLLTFRTFRAHAIAVPATWLPSQPVPPVFTGQIVEKPRWGSASRDVRILDGEKSNEIERNRDDVVRQELLEGMEITIDALLDVHGHIVHFVPRERIRVLAGESIQGRTIDDTDIREWVVEVLEHCASLGGRGVLTVQAFLTEKGPVLLEVNPRFGGGYPLSHAAGADYPALLVEMARGNHIAPRIGEYTKDLYFSRFYADRVFDRPLD